MERVDFDEWFIHHTGCFPGVRGWLAKIGPEEADEVMAAWARLLRDVDLKDAKRASDQLFASAEGAPRVYERHPAAIRDLATTFRIGRVPRLQYTSGGEQTYACPDCEDDGRLVVCYQYHGKNPMYRGKVITGTVRCHCEAGESSSHRNLIPFDPRRHVIERGGEKEADVVQRLKELDSRAEIGA